MAKIAYEDKNKDAALDSAPTLWRDIDANEVKNSVNALYDSVADVDLAVNSVQFDTTPAALPNADGLLQWNAEDGTLNLGMSGGDITMQIGQELFTKVVNKTAAPILNGTLVYFSGRLGLRPTIAPAKGDAKATSLVAGMATQDIAVNDEGYICTNGYVRGIKTNYATFVEGDKLWLSKTTAGTFTNVEPTQPHYCDVIGSVGIVNPSQGSVLIGITRHVSLDDLSAYNIDGHGIETTGDLLITFPAVKTLVLSEPTYRDEYPAMVIPASGAAAPDDTAHTIGGVARTLRAFDGNATQEILSGSFEIPHDYMIGEAIEVHVHWRPSTTGTGTVKWYLDWEYSPPNAAPIPQTVLSIEVSIASNKQYFHLLSSLGNLPQPSTPFAIGGKIGFNIRRTPTTDTYADDALLEQISLHVPCDTMGSRQIYVK